MSSVLTNTSAMSAVSAMTSTQRSIDITQKQISTGLRVASASDSECYWSMANTMRTKVGALQTVNDGLNITAAIVSVTAAALKNISSDVQDMKDLIVTAQSAGVDTNIIQQQIAQKQKEIVSTALAANFNGVNWLVAKVTGTRISSGETTYAATRADASDPKRNAPISFTQTSENTMNLTESLGSTSSGTRTVDESRSGVILQDNSLDPANRPDPDKIMNITSDDVTDVTSPDYYSYQKVGVQFAPNEIQQVDLKPIELLKMFTGTDTYNGPINFSDTTDYYGETIGFNDSPYSEICDDILGKELMQINIAGDNHYNLQQAQGIVEQALSELTAGQAFIGSLQDRISSQQTFNQAQADAITSGIGSLVDADMSQASTRLAALQTQQQLQTQAMSIANEGSRDILKLFGA